MVEHILLSKDITDNLYKPKSAFLNALDAGLYSLVKPPERVYYGKKRTKKSHTGVFFKFLFASDTKRVTFTSFDISNFLSQTMDEDVYSNLDDWNINTSEDVKMLGEFEIVSQQPVTLKNDPSKKKYPLFAFEGYEKYSKEILGKNADKRALLDELFKGDIKKESIDLYYRRNILTAPIVFN